jgi:hypothetical protein
LICAGKATVREVTEVLDRNSGVRGIVHELAKVMVCDRSGGRTLGSFTDEEILEAMRVLRSETAALSELNDELHAVDCY